MSNWLTYSPSSGYGDGTITITASTLSEIQDRVSAIIAKNNTYSVSASTSILQTYYSATGISLTNLVWVSDIPSYGSTANSANCSYTVIAYFDNGTTGDVTSQAVVSGELVVPATTAETRHSVGTLALTATFQGYSSTASVNAYQYGLNQVPTADTRTYLSYQFLGNGQFTFHGNMGVEKTIYYSINGGDWKPITSKYYDEDYEIVDVNRGDIVRFRGSQIRYNDCIIRTSNACNVFGNIMSLLHANNFATNNNMETSAFTGFFFSSKVRDASNLILPATALTEFCYASMFSECFNLIAPPSLPATSLANSCYGRMFSSCRRLPTAPALPATTLAENCYAAMFIGCWALETVPIISATTLAPWCYSAMFGNCSSLTNIPLDYLPVTTLADACYYEMFGGCTGLTTAPALPATALTTSGYSYMFWSCVSLTDAPDLPATTLASRCYEGMFESCTGLTGAPELPASDMQERCYQNMFKDCTSLVTAPELPATSVTPYCYCYMFSGCTSLTTAPSVLPATTLTYGCYYEMFAYCTSLTTAPALPATTLASWCYYDMFYGCSSLNYIKCLATDISASHCTSYWLRNVSATGTFVKNPNMTSWTTGVDGIPLGWTVQDAT